MILFTYCLLLQQRLYLCNHGAKFPACFHARVGSAGVHHMWVTIQARPIGVKGTKNHSKASFGTAYWLVQRVLGCNM
jgi:hypothetical protein